MACTRVMLFVIFYMIFSNFFVISDDSCVNSGCTCSEKGSYVKCLNGYPDFLPDGIKISVIELLIEDIEISKLQRVDFSQFLSLKYLILQISDDDVCYLIDQYNLQYQFKIENKMDNLCDDDNEKHGLSKDRIKDTYNIKKHNEMDNQMDNDDERDRMLDFGEGIGLVFVGFGLYVLTVLTRKFG